MNSLESNSYRNDLCKIFNCDCDRAKMGSAHINSSFWANDLILLSTSQEDFLGKIKQCEQISEVLCLRTCMKSLEGFYHLSLFAVWIERKKMYLLKIPTSKPFTEHISNKSIYRMESMHSTILTMSVIYIEHYLSLAPSWHRNAFRITGPL